MKKLLALLLALAMLFSLAAIFAGCEDSGKKKKSSSSSRDDEDEEEEEEDEEEETEDEDDEPTDEEDEGSDEPNVPEPATLPAETEPTETVPTEAAYGNQEGDLCYSYDLNVIDENGETGETIDPTKTGKVTVINFWGTWCSPCIAEMPHFDEAAKIYDISVVAVHSSYGRDEAPEFIGQYYADSRILFSWDSDSADNEYFELLGGRDAFPYTVILDKNGVITKKFVGSINYEELETTIIDAGAEKLDDPVPPSNIVDVQDGYFSILDSEMVSDYSPKCFHVPQVFVNGEILPNVSQLLMDRLLPKEEEYELQNMTYEWWQQGDILSILVRCSWVFNDHVSYQVYNFSLSQDRILDDFEFCQAMGVGIHDAKALLASYLQEYCDALEPSEYIDQATIDWLVSDTLSEENLLNSPVFLGADGQINFVTKIAVPAGSGWSVRLYNGNGEAYYVSIDAHESCE